MTGKRVFKKKSLPRKKRNKDTEAVLLIKGWQKESIKFFKGMERNVGKLRNFLISFEKYFSKKL